MYTFNFIILTVSHNFDSIMSAFTFLPTILMYNFIFVSQNLTFFLKILVLFVSKFHINMGQNKSHLENNTEKMEQAVSVIYVLCTSLYETV